MKITIEIPDDCYGITWMKTIILLSVGDRAKRKQLLDRSFDEWECFRSELADVVVGALLGMTPGYTHPEMNKAAERHQSICKKHLNQCLDL